MDGTWLTRKGGATVAERVAVSAEAGAAPRGAGPKEEDDEEEPNDDLATPLRAPNVPIRLRPPPPPAALPADCRPVPAEV